LDFIVNAIMFAGGYLYGKNEKKINAFVMKKFKELKEQINSAEGADKEKAKEELREAMKDETFRAVVEEALKSDTPAE